MLQIRAFISPFREAVVYLPAHHECTWLCVQVWIYVERSSLPHFSTGPFHASYKSMKCMAPPRCRAFVVRAIFFVIYYCNRIFKVHEGVPWWLSG